MTWSWSRVLIYRKDAFADVWITTYVSCDIQSKRILEAEWLLWLTARLRTSQGSDDIFHGVSSVYADYSSALTYALARAILISLLIVLGDIYSESWTTATILSTLGNPPLLCILESRMFFTLKEAAEHGVNIGTNWSSYYSAMHFDDSRDNTCDGRWVGSLPYHWRL